MQSRTMESTHQYPLVKVEITARTYHIHNVLVERYHELNLLQTQVIDTARQLHCWVEQFEEEARKLEESEINIKKRMDIIHHLQDLVSS